MSDSNINAQVQFDDHDNAPFDDDRVDGVDVNSPPLIPSSTNHSRRHFLPQQRPKSVQSNRSRSRKPQLNTKKSLQIRARYFGSTSSPYTSPSPHISPQNISPQSPLTLNLRSSKSNDFHVNSNRTRPSLRPKSSHGYSMKPIPLTNATQLLLTRHLSTNRSNPTLNSFKKEIDYGQWGMKLHGREGLNAIILKLESELAKSKRNHQLTKTQFRRLQKYSRKQDKRIIKLLNTVSHTTHSENSHSMHDTPEIDQLMRKIRDELIYHSNENINENSGYNMDFGDSGTNQQKNLKNARFFYDNCRKLSTNELIDIIKDEYNEKVACHIKIEKLEKDLIDTNDELIQCKSLLNSTHITQLSNQLVVKQNELKEQTKIINRYQMEIDSLNQTIHEFSINYDKMKNRKKQLECEIDNEKIVSKQAIDQIDCLQMEIKDMDAIIIKQKRQEYTRETELRELTKKLASIEKDTDEKIKQSQIYQTYCNNVDKFVSKLLENASISDDSHTKNFARNVEIWISKLKHERPNVIRCAKTAFQYIFDFTQQYALYIQELKFIVAEKDEELYTLYKRLKNAKSKLQISINDKKQQQREQVKRQKSLSRAQSPAKSPSISRTNTIDKKSPKKHTIDETNDESLYTEEEKTSQSNDISKSDSYSNIANEKTTPQNQNVKMDVNQTNSQTLTFNQSDEGVLQRAKKHQAAVTIQKNWKGYQTRKQLSENKQSSKDQLSLFDATVLVQTHMKTQQEVTQLKQSIASKDVDTSD